LETLMLGERRVGELQHGFRRARTWKLSKALEKKGGAGSPAQGEVEKSSVCRTKWRTGLLDYGARLSLV
jgi:hypothetical protein